MLPAFTPLAGLLLPLVLAAAPCAPACTCAPLTTEGMYRGATAVFLAEVITLEERPGSSRRYNSTRAVVQVTRRIKGEPPDTVALPSGFGPDCLVGFKPGERYLIFANRHGDVWLTSWCSGSAESLHPRTQERLREIEANRESWTKRMADPS